MRNALHIICGCAIMFVIGVLSKFSTYTIEGKIIGVPLLSAFIGLFIGFLWELYRWKIGRSYIDINDIIRTAIGSLIGGGLAVLVW